MNVLYFVGALVTIGLFVYLVAAMLKPEWFE
jgi:K+-transporting ATPase KdpF subunit